MPRYFTSSTLWYSGIFAAAATFDAGAKQQRRDKWDTAIAEVKQELAQPALARQEQKDGLDLQIENGVDDDTVIFRPFAGEDELDEFQYTDGQTRADWPANTGAPLTPRFLAPNSIYAEDKRRAIAELRKWTPKKLAMVQTSMDIMLLELMEDLHFQNSRHVDADWLSRELQSADLRNPDQITMRISEKQQRMRILRKADFLLTHYTRPEASEKKVPVPSDKHPLCHYGEDDENHFRSTQRDLNSSLQQLFRLHADERISWPSMIGKIIYNLRCSSAPPNVNTYNILLLGFSKADKVLPFKNVLRSFRRCHMRPNEITLATVLNHYAKIDDPVNFTFWIEMVRGGRGGLALARPDVEINEESSKRLMHHPEHPERVIQLPHHNPLVFGAMIAGVLNFTGFESALQICQSMGQEGWGLCMAGLTPLLHDCVRRNDWKAGLAVWDQIQALKAQSKRKEDTRWLTERIRLDTFAAMLRLCLKCDRRDAFDEIWALALRSHRGATEKLRSLIKGSGTRRSGDVVEESIAEVGRLRVGRGMESPVERMRRMGRQMRDLEDGKKRVREVEQMHMGHVECRPQPFVNYLSEDLEDRVAGEG